MSTEPKYRWPHAFAWLHWSYYHHGGVTAQNLLDLIENNCDGDMIQDMFQSDMDQDGFFEDLNAEPEKEEEDENDE